jgi:hypothetical protein
VNPNPVSETLPRPGRVTIAIGAAALAAGAITVALAGNDSPLPTGPVEVAGETVFATTTVAPTRTPTADQTPTITPQWTDPTAEGAPYPGSVEGLLTFRGNPTRTYYGKGPVPTQPKVLWSTPATGTWCAVSSAKTWCGTGWTGQPAVWKRNNRTQVAFGAYDRRIHVLDAADGSDVLAPFATGDIIKGSVTIDPDGYPLLYSGSRDNYFRVIALDREQPTELWKLSADAVSPTLWNNDWDGSALVLNDFLFEGGENSQLHIVKLNRGYDADGKVTVQPELVFNAPGWDQELLDNIGDKDVSIENSVAISGNTLYFANSGGLVQGWDITGLAQGATPTRVFRFWTGDDTDASVVVDADGYLYVGSEYERRTERSAQLGQFFKLDPRRPDDPVVWSLPIGQRYTGDGVWGTPALWRDIVIVPVDNGDVYAIDRVTGKVRWTKRLNPPVWQSPVVVDGVWIQGDCSGVLRAFDVRDTTVEPRQLWSVDLHGCVESTPAVWEGRIYVGARDGHFYALGDS